MLIKGISDYEGKPELDVQRDLSSLEMQCGQWRWERRQSLRHLRKQMHHGKGLADARDSKKRGYDEMTTEEQTCLQEWDTSDKIKKSQADDLQGRTGI